MPRFSNFGALDDPLFSEMDAGFVRMNNRLRADQLQPGELAYSKNGRMDIDGSWQTRKGVNFFGGTIGTSTEALIIPFYTYASKNILTAARVNTLVTVEFAAPHGFNTLTQVGIAGLTGTVNPNGNRTITVVDPDTVTFVIAGAAGSESYGGSGTMGSPYISDEVNECYGSCLFSDPANSNAEYIILVQNKSAVAINRTTAASTTIAYPTGLTITADCNLIQAFNKVYLFRNGLTAWSWDGSFSGTPAFVKVANGAYTQPLVLTTANNAACSGGVVTVTNTHNLSVGQTIEIIDEGTTGLIRFDRYKVASIATTASFTFYAAVDDFTAISIVVGAEQSNGGGFTHMPAPAWGVYHQRRLIVPFAYTTTGTSGSETITARNIKDELLFSDILDANTYDKLYNSFRVTAGVADYLQWVHPFTDDNAIAFNRNSIHLLSGLSGSLTDVSIKEITREAGLVAQRSVVTIGSSIYFLSDNGIYATDFGDLYNLRGAGLPLSEAIDPVMKRINAAYASNAVAVYHNNRYYIAVPLDSSITNNTLLVYNLLNKGWESIDVINHDGWDISNLIVGGAGTVNQLYAINRFGGIHIIDSRLDDVDLLALYPGVAAGSFPIESEATTRQYDMDSIERKRFNNFSLHIESSDTNASNANLGINTVNIDATIILGTLADYLGSTLSVAEDAEIRGRIGNIRAYSAQHVFTPTQGRPKLRMVKIEGSQSFRSLTPAS